MKSPFVYKEFSTKGTPETVRRYLADHFLLGGMKRDGVSPSGAIDYFRRASIFFSSKRPLTCITRMSLETIGRPGAVRVRIGVTFTMIKIFAIMLMALIWFGYPVLKSIFQGGLPDFSPYGCLVIPAGFFLHYTVRGRVIRYLKRTVERAGE